MNKRTLLAPGCFQIRGMSLLLAILVTFLSTMPVTSLADGFSIKVYVMLQHGNNPKQTNDAVAIGFNASMASGNWSQVANVSAELIYPPSQSTTPLELLRAAVEEHKEELFVVVGPGNDADALMLAPLLNRENLVAFGPYTGSNSVRGWNPNFYFLFVSPTAELLTLLRFAVTQLRLRRIGFMYLQNVSLGDSEYQLIVGLMASMGRELCGVFTLVSSLTGTAGDAEFDATWDHFVATRPQGVMIFAPQADDTTKFIERMVMDERTREAYLLTTLPHEFTIQSAWLSVEENADASLTSGKVILTGIAPLGTSTEYAAIDRFREDVAWYLENKNDESTKTYEDVDTSGEPAVYGWIVGQVLSQALMNREFLSDRKTFMESLYNQRRYVINDLVIGDFGGDCDPAAAEYGAVCQCNQGGNVVYMNTLASDYHLRDVPGGLAVMNPLTCHPDGVVVHSPVNGLIFFVWDAPLAQTGSEQIYDGIHSLSGDGKFGQSDRIFLQSFALASEDVPSKLKEELETRLVTAVFGAVDDEVLSLPGVAFIDPLISEAKLHRNKTNIIYLSPTLQQQLFVISNYLMHVGSGAVRVLVRGDTTGEFESMVEKTFSTFSVTLETIVTLDENTALDEGFAGNDYVIVIACMVDDAVAMKKHLDAYPNVHIFLPFFDMALMYEELIRTFDGSISAQRLLFPTSLPHWGDVNTTSETVQGFHATLHHQSLQTPLTLLGFTIARFLRTVIHYTQKLTSETLTEAIFTQSVVVVDDMRYGPFSSDACAENSDRHAGIDNCLVNYGATRISIWSLARAVDPSVPPLTEPATPSLKYTDPNESKITNAQLAGLIAGPLVTLLVVISLIIALFYLLRGGRRNRGAPKETKDPVTLFFSDIESSTALWAAFPELMPDAVAAHHRLIRTLIAKYGCYEVKTVGDSFMIASKSPFAAVQLARDLQQCFLHLDWGTAAFDEFYRQFEEQRAEGDSEYTPPTARLDPDVYGRLWSGLRVRVGIHTGLCDIRHDEVTKGYDYYGRTPNMAARTESVANGGQVLLTHAAYMSLSAEEREQLAVVSLGAMMLRGVPEPVKMWQLDGVPGRAFAALRLDHECLFSETEGSSASAGDASSGGGEMSGSSLMIASSLQAVFGTFPATQRRKMLVPLCERWHVPLSGAANGMWDERRCEDIICRIAAKVGRVVDLCVTSGSERSVSTLRSASLIIISNRFSVQES